MEINFNTIKIVLDVDELQILLANDAMDDLLEFAVKADISAIKDNDELMQSLSVQFDNEDLFSALMDALNEEEVDEYRGNQPEIDRLHNILFNYTSPSEC